MRAEVRRDPQGVAQVAEHPKYRHLTIEQLRAIDVPPGERSAARTINKLIERVSAVVNWAVRDGSFGMSKNPLQGLGVQDAPVKKRRAYTDDDLRAVFGSQEYRRGRFTQPYQYWLPLLGLFTGARLGELAQLHVADVTRVNSVWCLSINAEDDDGKKSVKNENSVRTVPVHSELERLGFVTWVSALRDAGTKQLFPEIPLQEKKTFSHTPSKWFGRYRKSRGLDGGELDFHSFRVTFITRLLDRGVQQHLVAQVAGHEKGMITGDVYWRPDIKSLGTVVEAFVVDASVLCEVHEFVG